jgi:hypothetical protein
MIPHFPHRRHNVRQIGCYRQRGLYAWLVRRMGMPFPHNEHNEEAKYVRYRNIPPVTQPSHNDFASGYILDSATPEDDPNQIMEPPKPTVKARKPQS